MRHWIKITAFISLAVYLYFLPGSPFYFGKWNFEINDSPVEFTISNLDQLNGSFATIKINPNIEKSIKIKFVSFKVNLVSFSFSKVKNFLQKEDIHFNLPLICYKFPLSEHTEAG